MLTNCSGSISLMLTDCFCRMPRWVSQFDADSLCTVTMVDADSLCTVTVVDAPPLSFHSSCNSSYTNTIKIDEKHLRPGQEKHSYGKKIEEAGSTIRIVLREMLYPF